MDADRQVAIAPELPTDPPIDPAAAPDTPARKAPRPSPAASILGALVSSAHADDSVKHDFVAMRSGASRVDGLSVLDRLAAPEVPAAAPGGAEGAAKAAQTLPQPAPEPPRPLAERVLGVAKSIGSDLVRGAMSAPGQIVGGVLDYGNNLMKFADTVVKHAEENGLPSVYFRLFDKDGKWSPAMESATEFRKAQAEGREDVFQLPTTGDPDTVTGNIVRTGTSFLIGRGNIAGKGAGVAKNALADVVSGATSMDPNSPRLSNIIDQVAPNAVTNFLKAKPEDEATVLGHIKAGLEMGGIGMAFTGVVKTLKALKGALSSTEAPVAEAGAEMAPAGVSTAAEAPAAATADAGASAAPPGATASAGASTGMPFEQIMARKRAQEAALGARLSEMSGEEVEKAYQGIKAHNDVVERQAVEKFLGADKLKEYDALKGARARSSWLDKNVTDDAQDFMNEHMRPEDFAKDFVGAAGAFDETSPKSLGESIAVLSKDVDKPGFMSSPAGATFKAAMRYANEQGWDMDEVLSGMRSRASRWAGDDAEELFGRLFKQGEKKPSALDHILAMESDLPWEQGSPGVPGPSGTKGAAAGAKDLGGVGAAPDVEARRALALGYPKPETGHPLAPVGEGTATVEVSPELKGRFEKYMAQERGEVASPLEANDQPLAAQRSADFSATGGNPVKVNLNAINGPADLKDAIARVSAQIPAQAVRHNEAVLDAAQSLGMDADAFLAGPGRALSDTEVVGLRMVANDVARQALDHFKAAAIPGASEESRATALASYAKFNDMIAYMEGAKAESGRGVQAWGIKVAGLDVPYMDAVKKIAASAGEPGTPEFMERMGALDSPEAVATAARAARTMTPRDWMMYGWYNALLGPKTVVKKGLSDTFMGLWNLTTRYAAEAWGPSGGVKSGETAALLQGYKSSFGDALALARKAFTEGRSQFHGGSQFLEAFDNGQALADSAPQLAEDAPTFAMRDFMRVAASPKSYLPTTWVGAIDDFATMLNYQAERHALAYRTAAGKGLAGDELQSAVASLESATPSWLHHQAVTAAMQNTFKEPLTGVAASMAEMVDKMNIPLGHGTGFELPVGRIVMPFIKIPTNIVRWSYTNSPLPLLMPSSKISAELAAGGATRDLALARIGLGSALSLSALGLTLSGTITGKGPSDRELQRAWRDAGNEPHSIKIGEKQYSYNSVEPVGLMLGIIADTHDIMRYAKEEDAGQAGLSLVFGAGQALMSKTYLEGVASVFQALENPDRESARYVQHLLSGAAVPNTIAQINSAMDPWMRQHYDLLESIESRLPYISQGLPPQRTLWGDAIPVKTGYLPFASGSAAAQILSPVTVGPNREVQPIDQWIFDNRMAFPRGPDNKLGLTRPGIVQNFSAGPQVSAQVQLTPEQHDRLQVLAGNELKDPATKMGAKDTLNALVEDRLPGAMQQQWNRASDAERALIVQSVVNKFRTAAKQQIRQEFPDLQEAISDAWQQRAAALSH